MVGSVTVNGVRVHRQAGKTKDLLPIASKILFMSSMNRDEHGRECLHTCTYSKRCAKMSACA